MLAADLETTQRPKLPKTNISNRNELQRRFDLDMKEEIRKLEGVMKIGWSTLKCLGNHLRSKKYPNEEELKKLKFSKNWIKRFNREHKITKTNRKSNQKKVSEEELVELRKPINDILSRFDKNRVINIDETGLHFAASHQKGSFTCETDMDNFKEGCLRVGIF